MFAADFNPRVSGIRSSMNRRMATTPWNGWLRCPTQMERSECMAAPTWERRNFLRPLPGLRTWRAFAPTSPPPIITMAGRTRAARSSSGSTNPGLADWLAHPNYDEYWKQWSIEDHYAQIQVPVFSLGAWYDIFLGGTLRNYVRLKQEAGTEEGRRGQKLMVYVGGHAGGSDSKKVGAVDFGEKLPFNFNEVVLSWYDALLRGQTSAVSAEKPVKIFVMGKNEWREEEDWPLAR